MVKNTMIWREINWNYQLDCPPDKSRPNNLYIKTVLNMTVQDQFIL